MLILVPPNLFFRYCGMVITFEALLHVDKVAIQASKHHGSVTVDTQLDGLTPAVR